MPLPADSYQVGVSFTGDDYYRPCATQQDVVVTVAAAAAKVTGGGWISITTGRTNFGFNLIPQAGATYKGQFQLVSTNSKSKFHGSGAAILRNATSTAANWSGTGSWNGSSGYTYSLGVVDNGSSGGRKGDTVTITITSPSGSVVYSTGGSQVLKGGNITVH